MNPKCPECGSSKLYEDTEIDAGGSQRPDLLPRLGTFFSYARMKAVLCTDCGLLRFYANEEVRTKARDKWNRVSR